MTHGSLVMEAYGSQLESSPPFLSQHFLSRRGLPSFLRSLPPLILDSPFFKFHSGIGASTRDLASLFSQETRANGQAENVYTQTCRHNFSLFMHTSVFSSHYHCSLSPAGDFSLRDYKKYANAIVKE